jgi:hypothetical protein
MKTLDQIACEQGTDRASSGWHDYMRTYDELFSHLRHQPVTMLEMGTLQMEGIRTWCEYFTNPDARIIGIDIMDWKPKPVLDPRFTFRLGSQTDEELLGELPDHYDIIIDDAGHFASAQMKAFSLLWPRLKPGGFYAIEDLHSAWCKVFCDAPVTIMQFLERIMSEMQDQSGVYARARRNPQDRWSSLDQIIIRKGLAVLRKTKP